MSQHDMTVDNGAGVAVRADINNALKALASQSSGPSAPTPTFPAQVWADTGTGRLKQRDAANATWVDKGPIDGAMAPLDSPVFTGQPQGSFPSIVGAARNLRMSITTASASGTMTADEVVVKASLGGLAYRVGNFSKTINLATTGAGGMDIGTAPVSGFVAIYAIYNPATSTSALLAANATSAVATEIYGGANMPAGYTASGLLQVLPTNASSQFIVGFVDDRKFVFLATITATQGSNNSSYTAQSLSASVPKNARKVGGYVIHSASSSGSVLSSFLASASSGVGEIVLGSGSVTASSGYNQPFNDLTIITAQTMYFKNSSSIAGQSFTPFISSYYI